jgi:protein-tyrosine phosphatase
MDEIIGRDKKISKVFLPNKKIILLGDYNSIPFLLDDDNIVFFSFISRKEFGRNKIFNDENIIEFPFDDKVKKIKSYFFPMSDIYSDSEKIFSYSDLFHKKLEKCLNSGKIPYIHCFAGMSRSVSMLCTYLIKKFRMSDYDSIEYIRMYRTIISPNYSFVRKLFLYYSYDQ